MADVAIIDSELRQMPIELFRELLKDYQIDHIRLSSGSIVTDIDEKYDLTPYRAIYLRVGAITEGILSRCPNLELVATCGSGYDHIDVEAATEAGVMVTHTPGAPAPGVVEHTFGVMFSMIHQLPEMFERTSKGEWKDGQTIVGELYGKTLGVVGLGTIGSKVASIATQQFNAEVLGYDPYVTGDLTSNIYPRVSQEEMASKGITFVDWMDLFNEADIVTLHIPHTKRTDAIVGIEELTALEGGYLINTSRGGVIDENSLIQAIQDQLLAGVALDVMSNEPPEPNNPLLGQERVFITPHVAGGTEGYAERSVRINAERIATTLSGNKPDNLVNPEVLNSA